MNLVFYLSAVVAVIATAMVITRKSAMHSLLYLVVSFLAISLIFFTLGAPFIAALEVIVYAGAIMVLFIFAIMLLNISPSGGGSEGQMRPGDWVGPSVLSLILLAELVYALVSGANVSPSGQPAPSGAAVAPNQVGASLFTTYLIGVELASVLLLSSVIGAYHLGQGHREEEEAEREEMVVFKETAVEEGVPEAAPGELEPEKER